MFITFEGGEGSGKSTLILKLADYFQAQKRPVITTREPGGSIIAEDIRKVLLNKTKQNLTPKTEALLFAAARLQHLEDTILPAINENKIILCDRYIDSSYVYQGFARNLSFQYIKKINDFIDKKATPDITFLLDVDPELGLKRVNTRSKSNQNRIDFESLEFHKSVRSAYLDLAAKNKSRFIIIDSNKTIDDMFLEIIDKLSKNKKFLKHEKLHKVF